MLKNDLHIHSIGSGHAYSTISEIFKYASDHKMDIIAIADHGPNMEGASHLGYFENITRLPKVIGSVLFLKSCEANILNTKGEIDIPPEIQNKLDFVMAGIHRRTDYLSSDNKDKNTEAIINAIVNNNIKVITHPIRPEFPVNILAITKMCAKNKVSMEINLETLRANRNNTTFIRDIKSLIDNVIKNNGKLVISSDAHFVSEIGDDSILKELKIHIPLGILLKTKDQILRFINNQ